MLVVKIAHFVLGEELGYSLTNQSERVVLFTFSWAWAFKGKRERNSREAYIPLCYHKRCTRDVIES